MRQFLTVARLALVLTVVGGLFACAGDLHARLVTGNAAVEKTFALVDDGEREACFGTRSLAGIADPTHCSTPLATRIGLEKLAGAKFVSASGVPLTVHQALSKFLADAFKRVDRVQAAIDVFVVGQPVPADVANYKDDAATILTLAGALDGADPTVQAWLANVRTWVQQAIDLYTAFGGA